MWGYFVAFIVGLAVGAAGMYFYISQKQAWW